MSKFEKVLNKRDVFVIAFGAMIGWGWVVQAGDWIIQAGTMGAILSFIFGGVMVYFVGLAYAELTAAMPECGGVHVFSMRALGKNASFVCTWSIILGYVGVVAFEAVAFPTVLQYIAPGFMKGYMYTVAGFDVYATWVLVGVVSSLIITFINLKGVKTAAVMQTILTVSIAAVGIALLAGSVVTGNAENVMPLFAAEPISGILNVLVLTPFFFVGFDVIPQAAEEINVPVKKIGGIMLLSIIMAIAWYALIIFAVSFVMDEKSMVDSVLVTADAMKIAFGNQPIAANILIIGGLAGIITTWNSFFMGGSRAIYALAEANMLPKFLGKLHPKHKTPTTAIILIGLISCIAPFFGRKMMLWLTNAGSLSIVVTYCLVSVSFVTLRFKEPKMNRPYKVKNGVICGVLAILLSMFFIALYVVPVFPSALVFEEWIIVAGWIILGVVFFSYSKLKYKNDFGANK